MANIRMNPRHCKSCMHMLDAFTSANKEADKVTELKEGCLTVCYYCGQISKFDKDLDLVAITEEEMETIKKNDYDDWLLLQRAAYLISERINKS